MKYCTHCDKTFPDGYKKCPYCKRSLKQRYRAICPHCHKEIKNLSKPYCEHCGEAITIPGMRIENPVERLKRSRPGFYYLLALLLAAVGIVFSFFPCYIFHDASTNEVTASVSGLQTVLYLFTGKCDFFTALGGGRNLSGVLVMISFATLANWVICGLIIIFDIISLFRVRGRNSRRAANLLAWSVMSLIATGVIFFFVIYLSIFYRQSGHTVGSFADYYLALIQIAAVVILLAIMIIIKATKLTRKYDRVL